MIVKPKPTIEEELVSRGGYKFRLGDDKWRLCKDIAVPVSKLKKFLDPELYLNICQVLAFYAVSASSGYVSVCYYRCKCYLKATVGQTPFGVESFISYRSRLDKKSEWKLAAIRTFIKQWHALAYPGISDEVVSSLTKWRLAAAEQGYAVQSMCPESGPLTDIEMQGLVEATTIAFGEGKLSLEDTALMLIFAMTGRRPVQVAALKIKDIVKQSSDNGGRSFFINFPRAKQLYQGWRRSFNKFPISEDLWLVLEQQAISQQQKFESLIGYGVPELNVPELPLFSNLNALEVSASLELQLTNDLLHMRTKEISGAFRRVSEAIKLISERTGQPIRLNAYRFRYTLGTNLAREGRREFIIAEALDHSDTQHVGVYVKNIPDIVRHINKAVALRLGPVAQAFQGVLVSSEDKAIRGSDSSSRITNRGQGVGTCGGYGFCTALAPIACYTCNNFQPWLNGPHELVLDSLLSERDRILEQTSDLRIASVNDRLILAVSEVVVRCEARKKDTLYVENPAF